MSMPKFEIILKSEQANSACFLIGEEEHAEKIYDMIGDDSLMLISVGGIDWNRDLSPWKAEKVFKKGEDFGGQAEKLLEYITEEVIPSIDNLPKKKFIAGYSLAGLFSLWACFNTDEFQGFCSCSGSMWFDGFVDYVENNRISTDIKCGYFSLGDRESHSKNPRMATVLECTEKIISNLSILSINCDIIFKLVSGNHFQDADKRLADGILSVISRMQSN